MSRRWTIVAILAALAAVTGCASLYIWHLMDVVPKGMSEAPPTTPVGYVQLILTMMSSAGFTFTGFVVAVMNFWHGAETPKPGAPSDPGTPSDSLSDLILAFPEFIGDRTSKPKAMRFWFDLLQVGIEHDPDAETKAWLQQGSEILRRKFFPPITPDPVKPS